MNIRNALDILNEALAAGTDLLLDDNGCADQPSTVSDPYHLYSAYEDVLFAYGSYSDTYAPDIELERGKERIGIYPLKTWVCTDTEVGYRAYFLDGELIAVGYKPYRSSPETLYYADGMNSKTKFKDFIISLVPPPPEESHSVDVLKDISDEEMKRLP